jgi:hypothetical protein
VTKYHLLFKYTLLRVENDWNGVPVVLNSTRMVFQSKSTTGWLKTSTANKYDKQNSAYMHLCCTVTTKISRKTANTCLQQQIRLNNREDKKFGIYCQHVQLILFRCNASNTPLTTEPASSKAVNAHTTHVQLMYINTLD